MVHRALRGEQTSFVPKLQVDGLDEVFGPHTPTTWHAWPGLPDEVAAALVHVIRNAYAGIVRSLSCSTSVVGAGRRSAVSSLQRAQGHQGPPGDLVSGVALNHPAYESGRRRERRMPSGGS